MNTKTALQLNRTTCDPISQETLRQVIEITGQNVNLTSSALLALRGTNRDLNQIVCRSLCKTDIAQEFPLKGLRHLANISSLNCRGFYNPPNCNGDLWEIQFQMSDPLWIRALKCWMLFYKPFNRIQFRLKQIAYQNTGGQLLDAELHNLRALPTLKQLRLENLRFITDRGLVEIGQLSRLSFLSLRNCHNVTGRGMRDLCCLHQLKSIDLTGKTPYQLQQSGALEALADLPELQEVKLGAIWQSQLEILANSRINQKFKSLVIQCITSDIFDTLINLSQLENLALVSFSQDFSAFFSASKLSTLRHLHTLAFFNELSGIEQLSPIFDALSTMAQFTSLHLGELNQSDMESLLQLTQLQSLMIDRDRSSFSSEINVFSKLKYLKLSWPSTIRGDVLLSNSELETLDLESEFATLSAITSLRHLPKLKSLNLSRAIFPKNFELSHLADLESLQELNLSDYEFSQIDLSSLSSDLAPKLPIPLPNLEQLIFRGKEISSCLFDFIAKCPKLMALDLARSQFEEEDLQKLRDERPQLCIQLASGQDEPH